MEGTDVTDVTDSALVYKCFTYTKDNGNVYIKARFVLVSSIYRCGDFLIDIHDGFSDAENIYFTDGKHDRLIWSKS